MCRRCRARAAWWLPAAAWRPTIPSPALFRADHRGVQGGAAGLVRGAGRPVDRVQEGAAEGRHRRAVPSTLHQGTTGVVLVGVAQERANGWRGVKRARARGSSRSTIVRTTVCVEPLLRLLHRRGWGPGFLKICGYAPYTLKLCLNGHEWAKRQLTQAGDRVRGARQRVPLVR